MLNGIRCFAAEFLTTCALVALCLSSAEATLIQFGSCNKQDRINSSAAMVSSIASVKSDVFIWLGEFDDDKHF
jgi:hypothetical protein